MLSMSLCRLSQEQLLSKGMTGATGTMVMMWLVQAGLASRMGMLLT